MPRRPARTGGADARSTRHAHARQRRPRTACRTRSSSAASSVTPGAGRIDEEQVDVGVAVAGAGQHDERGRRRRERHVPLHAVEHEPVAVGASRVSCTPCGPKPVAGLEPRGRDDRVAGRDARQPLAPSARRSPPAAARPRPSPRSRSAATARAPGRAPCRRPRPRAASSPSRRTRPGSMSPIRSSSAICFQSSVGIPDRVVLELRARCRAARTSCTRRAPSRAASPARRVRSRSISSSPVVVMVATGRRGGSRGCRRRRSAARCARCSRS